MTIFILIILLILFIIWVSTVYFNIEGFSNVPIEKKINDIRKYKELFSDNKTYNTLRKKISWIDPIYYYDLKRLYINGKMNERELNKYFSNSI